MADALVVNASPLIFLGNAGRLDLLLATGASQIIVPQAVIDEVTIAHRDDRAAQSIKQAKWIERAASIETPPAILEWDLGPGESSVIATALATPQARPVLDDLLARRCALALGLNVIGTLGLAVAAFRRGEVDDLRQIITDLRAAGMWLSEKVIDRALRLAKQ